jgi:hypothetical protein
MRCFGWIGRVWQSVTRCSGAVHRDTSEQQELTEGLHRDDGLPSIASTELRAAAAWWTVFLGPVIVAGSLLVVGLVTRGSIVWITWCFTFSVWAFSLTVGLAATPRGRSSPVTSSASLTPSHSSGNGLWWIPAFLLSFLSAGLALGLVVATNGISRNVNQPSAPTPSPSITNRSPTSTSPGRM